MARYVRPDWFTRRVFNPAVATLARLGISVLGSRVLRVRGRRTGEWRSTPVNLMRFQGGAYLVAPRGNTDWVRNLRAAGWGELQVGRHRERFTSVELPDQAKPPLLRDYLRRWRIEAGAFFDGVTAESPDSELQRVSPDHPVFRVDVGPEGS